MKTSYLLFIFLISVNVAFAQQPFKQYGYKVKVATLSQGKYQEDFTSDSLVQVGSVILSRITGKIVSFISYDTVYSEATLYPELLGRWMSPDPLADKYFNFSPYNYVLNNPLKFIDSFGKDVELIIGKPYSKDGKEHPYGHVAIRVYGKGYNYVFDFGRYGSTWALGAKGDGIMNVYSDGSKYIKNEQKFRESIGFNLSTSRVDDKKVIDYYLNLAKEGEVYKTGEVPGGGGTAYKLKEDYSVLSNNCSTKSAEGLEQIDENHIGDEYDPRDLLKNIESNYEDMGFTKRTEYLKGGGIKITYERKPDEKKEGEKK